MKDFAWNKEDIISWDITNFNAKGGTIARNGGTWV